MQPEYQNLITDLLNYSSVFFANPDYIRVRTRNENALHIYVNNMMPQK